LEGRAAALRALCDALGLLREGYFERKRERWLKKGLVTRAEIEGLIARRNQARDEKNWPEADRIRDQLQRMGVAIEDTPGGAVWKVR
jgi:cysteinyl-tRNA synthetase